jgi:hypothetical protein
VACVVAASGWVSVSGRSGSASSSVWVAQGFRSPRWQRVAATTAAADTRSRRGHRVSRAPEPAAP